MMIGAIIFLVVAAAFQLVLPRRWALVPLLMAAAYTTRLPVVQLGPANLSVLRILVVIGLARAMARGERITNGLNAIDGWLCAWAVLLIATSAFHTSDAWAFRIGMVWGDLGAYFMCRIFIQDADDVRRIFKVLCVGLAPLAVLMLMEKATAYNYFGMMGSTVEASTRDGHVRAFGPFGHPILAGTVGATCLPMALSLWRSHRLTAIVGLFSALGIVFASTSSGPIMMVVFTCAGLLIWNIRSQMTLLRWGSVAAIVLLQIVMNDPVYFLMARIDITGGSTGWYRAQLIRSSIQHIAEWWAVGTDYTRHWMATGIHANDTATDITNHFLAQGVMGGLPLMLILCLALTAAFRAVGRALKQQEDHPVEAYLIWVGGTMLFAQVVNFWSISLFDQSIAFFYLVLAAVAALEVRVVVEAAQPVERAIGGARPQRAVLTPAPAARTTPSVPVAVHKRWADTWQGPTRTVQRSGFKG